VDKNNPTFRQTLQWVKAILPNSDRLRYLSDSLRVENLRKIEDPKKVEDLLSETTERLEYISKILEKW